VKGRIDNRHTALLLGLLIGSAAFVGRVSSSSAATTAGTQRFSLYAVTTRAQFVNYQDGITRAQGNNPFNADTNVLPIPKLKNGATPGNAAFFTLKVYANSNLKQSVGSASYTCTYNFNGQAICEAYFDLDGGTLFASGPVNFAKTVFTLAVASGTSKYIGVSGEVVAAQVARPAAKNETRLEFDLPR